jgi:hypothetical protein
MQTVKGVYEVIKIWLEDITYSIDMIRSSLHLAPVPSHYNAFRITSISEYRHKTILPRTDCYVTVIYTLFFCLHIDVKLSVETNPFRQLLSHFRPWPEALAARGLARM